MILVLKEWKKVGESDKLVETVKVLKGNFQYVDAVITQGQIKNLKTHGNTVLDRLVYDKVGKKNMIKELKRLTGLDCDIRISSGTVIVETVGRSSNFSVRKN